jgi:hypothetical protein
MNFIDIALSSIGLVMVAMMFFFCVYAVIMVKTEDGIGRGETFLLIPCMFISLIVVLGVIAAVGCTARGMFCFFTGIGCF